MNNQYHASPRLGGKNPHGIGTVPVGTIVYIQDRLGRYDRPIRRNPWIVVAWMNRTIPDMRKILVGGHLALVRSLRDGRLRSVADHLIRYSLEAAS